MMAWMWLWAALLVLLAIALLVLVVVGIVRLWPRPDATFRASEPHSRPGSERDQGESENNG